MPQRKKPAGGDPAAPTVHTVQLTDAQLERLEALCDRRNYGWYDVAHSLFAFKAPHEKVNLVAYKSGKLVIQGKGTAAFVRDVVEAEITGEAKLGYEEVHHPEWFEPHAGLDEAGKGDFFGPLVAACVIADGDMVRAWRAAGLQDSKNLGDKAILRLEKQIRSTEGVVIETVSARMPRYNELMSRPGANLNHLLAWFHAQGLQKALAKRQVDWGLLDQFSKAPLTQRQLAKEGVTFDLRMRTKAEEDPVVAAASVCARAAFVRAIDALSKEAGVELKKGASAAVKAQGRALVEQLGAHRLKDFAKVHFKTAYEVLGLPVPAKS